MLRDLLILQEAMNQSSMEGIVRLIRKVLLYSLAIEASCAALLALRWAVDMPFGRALYYGIFHAVSMFNNAGFDIFGGYRSLTGYVNDPTVNIVVMFLIVSGGIGFIVMSDLMDYRKSRRLLLHTKVVLSMTAALILIGTVVIFVFEFTNSRTLGPLNLGGKLWASFFQSVTPRTAGANTVDIAGLRQASQFFIVILMFIGASPGSTGGGIKTTTFTLMIGAVVSMLRGREDIVLFRYSIGAGACVQGADNYAACFTADCFRIDGVVDHGRTPLPDDSVRNDLGLRHCGPQHGIDTGINGSKQDSDQPDHVRRKAGSADPGVCAWPETG